FRTPFGLLSDSFRTPFGLLSDSFRTPFGLLSDSFRTPFGLLSDSLLRSQEAADRAVIYIRPASFLQLAYFKITLPVKPTS
ncbi:MAG: hypothetical protein JNM40_12170, partial [Myxococcales bacterium]|nr:hypothetical protein [Myxococcales bacterium]